MKYKKFLAVAMTCFCCALCGQPVYAQQTQPEQVSQNIENEAGAEAETVTESETETEAETEIESDAEAETEIETEIETEPETPAIPGQVKGLTLTCVTDKQVLIEWNEDENAVSYEIYRKTGDKKYQLIGETEDCEFLDKKITFGKTYDYKVIAYNADGQKGEAGNVRLNHTQAVQITAQKYSYAQMKKDLHELAAKYSNYCTVSSIGKSVEGRNIYDIAIGNPYAEESLLVVSTLHAREYICSAILMQEIEYYLRNYNKSIRGMKAADICNDIQIHYIVMANPDGVTISQTSYPRWKSNGRGVDLNRNFPAKKFIVGGKRGAQGYSGKKALSEPESKAIAMLTKELKKTQKLRGVINYHAMGQIVFGDCDDKKLKADTKMMYQIARELTGYHDAGGYGNGQPTPGGGYREYVMDMLKIPSITLEVGYTSAPCAFSEYQNAFEKNKLVVLKIADRL